jgi:hypothetical protein
MGSPQARRRSAGAYRAETEEDRAGRCTGTRCGLSPAGGNSVARRDPQSLPPIETIGAGSDIRPFLATGVRANLTRAALRRAWSADPAIRDFIGLSESSWDFNALGGYPPRDEIKVSAIASGTFGVYRASAASPS